MKQPIRFLILDWFARQLYNLRVVIEALEGRVNQWAGKYWLEE